MKILIVVFLLSMLVVFQSKAQYPVTNTPKKSEIKSKSFVEKDSLTTVSDSVVGPWDHLTIISDKRINKLLEIKKEENVRQGVSGYRLQIYQGNKDEAYRLKSKFLEKYPDSKVYVQFKTTDFRVRIGDFRTKSEAIKLKYLVERDFPNPLIVEDIINFPELETTENKTGTMGKL